MKKNRSKKQLLESYIRQASRSFKLIEKILEEEEFNFDDEDIEDVDTENDIVDSEDEFSEDSPEILNEEQWKALDEERARLYEEEGAPSEDTPNTEDESLEDD